MERYRFNYIYEIRKKLLIEEKFKINNLDITLICEKPKVSKYKKLFLESVCKSLEVDKSLVNIKGTTTEKLGFLGREEEESLVKFQLQSPK